ncbi:hypothetical protein [Inquilinus sp. CA228]|uniref:hypothetical protein n=1 Tax=Inquilinus sp. CA228 TaxID=3455609 RepID=UPI003F8D88A7
MKTIGIGLLFLALTVSVDAAEAPKRDQPQRCDIGPLHRTYGGRGWLVYSCPDKSTLIISADKDNPAVPFVFMFYYKDNAYHLYGEGAGQKEYTAAAFEELNKLNARDIASLIAATQKE